MKTRHIRRKLKKLLASPNWLLATVSVTVWVLLFFIFLEVGLLSFLENRTVRPLEFHFRDALGLTPEVHPNLKAYALDDSTAAMLKAPELTPTDWVDLLTAMTERKPKTIIIDKMFGLERGLTEFDKQRLNQLATINPSITVGSVIKATRVRYRQELPPQAFSAAIRHHPFDKQDNAHTPRPPTGVKQWPNGHVYGPSKLFQKVFRHIGHIMVEQGNRFAPAIQINNDIIIPHVSLFAGDNRYIAPHGVVVDGTTIPTNSDNLSIVNFLPPSAIYDGVHSLTGVLTKARTGAPLSSIERGDIVLIFNTFTTGNTDFIETPYGLMPGGVTILAITNSLITKDWLYEFDWQKSLIVFFTVLGCMVGLMASTAAFWGYTIGFGAAYLLMCLLTFSIGDIFIPWFFPLCSFMGCGLTIYAVKRYEESKRRIHLEVELATASALQRNFFPEPTLSHPDFTLVAYYHPADAIGGDWYSYDLYNDEWLHVHLGDVTGHGASSALLASFAKGATELCFEESRRLNQDHIDLSTLHNNLNEMLSRNRGDRALMTMVSMAINIKTGLTLSLNSGHRPAIVLESRSSNITVLTRDTSSILGFKELPKDIKPQRTQLVGDEYILIYSDGLLDVPWSHGIKTSERRLVKILESLKNKPADEIRSQLLKHLGMPGFENLGFCDDVTFIVIKLHFRQTNLTAKPLTRGSA